MKTIVRKKFGFGSHRDVDHLAVDPIIFDKPFVGKVSMNVRKVGRSIIVELEVDGYEY